MKNILYRNLRICLLPVMLSSLIVSCKKMSDVAANQSNVSDMQIGSDLKLTGFKTAVLNANKASYGPVHIDKNLHNAWGMSASDEGEIWVSAADAGLSFVYNVVGDNLMPPVNIPSHKMNVPGNPTGNIYNESSDFVIPGTKDPAEFLFASEDGTISAWNDATGSSAVVVIDKHKNASYKGIATAESGGNEYLYATNFETAKIDVFDGKFNRVHMDFTDNDIPDGYAPFNIREVKEKLFVTYALRTKDGEEDSTGAGLGFVDVYSPDGSLVKRFASHGTLNAPWGITTARPGLLGDDAILIGNFGDGHINVFDMDGNYKGQMMNGSEPIAIEGLWAIDNNFQHTSARQLYFTAGPNDEEDGLFGFVFR
ncbi:MAG TPA: TIGR03118 family protein [Parafilimonas sp.]|nr:TIGR03118 family protein [Parafilimonas sp.]